MPRVLFLAAHRPDRSPSQRFRFEQYFDFLRENGFVCELSYIISVEDDKVLYGHGNAIKKAGILKRAMAKRATDVRRYSNFDIVFVQREAIMIGSTRFEKKIKNSGAAFIFDFDDSIWMMDTSEGNKKWEWLKKPKKTPQLIAMADLVFAGNRFLADYSSQFNSNVIVIPTTVDTDRFVPDLSQRNGAAINIGWSGSITTIKHFKTIENVLEKVKQKYGDRVRFTVVGDSDYNNAALQINGVPWSSEDEVKILNSFDIGIMPLPDDKWAKGKCGLKGLTYMALEIPVILSAVGVNTEIIQDGVNGFLASNEVEWFQKISQLIENVELRKRLGEAARKTVIEKYSVLSQRENYLSAFKSLLKKSTN